MNTREQFQMMSLQMEVLSLRSQNAQLQAQVIGPEYERLRAAVEAEDKKLAEAAIAKEVGKPASSVSIEGVSPQV
jgi:ribosomal protein L18